MVRLLLSGFLLEIIDSIYDENIKSQDIRITEF